MTFKYEPGQILIEFDYSKPDFYRIDKRTACYVTLTKLDGQRTLVDESQGVFGDWLYEVVPTSEPWGDPPSRWKIDTKENGDESICGLDLWEGNPERYWISNSN